MAQLASRRSLRRVRESASANRAPPWVPIRRGSHMAATTRAAMSGARADIARLNRARSRLAALHLRKVWRQCARSWNACNCSDRSRAGNFGYCMNERLPLRTLQCWSAQAPAARGFLSTCATCRV